MKVFQLTFKKSILSRNKKAGFQWKNRQKAQRILEPERLFEEIIDGINSRIDGNGQILESRFGVIVGHLW